MSDVYNSILLDMKKLKGVKRIALAGRDGYLMGDYA